MRARSCRPRLALLGGLIGLGLLGGAPAGAGAVEQAPFGAAAGPHLPLRAAPFALEKVPFRRLTDAEAYAGPEGATRRARAQAQRAHWAQRNEEMHRLLGPHRVSRRGLRRLADHGLGPARLAGAAGAAQEAAAGVDTLRVLLVRISFESDRSGALTSVTEDGNFQLTPDPTVLIDPPPHDRAFFESHLFGLSEYYTFQSGGRLAIEGRVMPPGAEDSYRLTDLADYGPGQGGNWTIAALERLVRDMIAVADSGLAADGIDLSDYGDDQPFAYVIFVHAGSDWQSDVLRDSPNDVPTFFVSLGEAAPLAGGGRLGECSVIPETTSQDGYLGSIAAPLYHEFGHALGLVDIYDTHTGLPQVGIWSLMDSGTNLAANIGIPTPGHPDSLAIVPVVGLLPPSLGAWDKWFLGWVQTQEIDGGAFHRLPAVQVPRARYGRYRAAGYDFQLEQPQVLRGGASDREFFLIENRWVPLYGEDLPETGGDPANLYLVRDAQTGVVLFLGGDPDGDGPSPVLNTGMYDFFLPDGGLLVWHANQERIDANLETNAINARGDGLRLVEADGIQDIGVLSPYILGFFGSYRDPFHAGTSPVLGQEGAPSSRAFDRSWTGLMLRGISANEALMSCEALVAPLLPGFPLTLPPLAPAEADPDGAAAPRALEAASPTPLLVGGVAAVVYADGRGPRDEADRAATLFAARLDGSPAVPAAPSLPAGAFARLTAPLAGPPLMAPPVTGMAGDAGPLICADAAGWVTAFSVADLSPAWPARRRAAALAAGPVAAALPGGGMAVLLCAPPDSLLLIDGQGEPLGAPLALGAALPAGAGGFAAPPVVLPPEGGTPGFLVFLAGGWLRLEVDAGGLPTDTPALIPYGFGLGQGERLERALLRRPQGPLLVLFGPAGGAAAWDLAGSAPAPAAWPGRPDGAPVGEPAVADLDGNGVDDVVLATSRRIHAWQADGVPLRGFPLPLRELFPLADSTRLAAPLVVCDATGDGRNEVLLATDRGHLVGLDATGGLLWRTPFLWGTGPAFGLAVGPGAGSGERVLWLADAGGWAGPPLERRWLNGRLSGYRLPAGAPGAATSEWLGPGGGPSRDGPRGAARDLGPLSPLAAERERLVVYPNPARSGRVTVRFYSADATPARLAVHNLEGELVAEALAAAAAGQMNEHVWELPRLVSGIYLVTAEVGAAQGRRRLLARLAVER